MKFQAAPSTDETCILENIRNTKSFQWTIPTNISDEVLRSPAYFSLTNGITETQTFITEQMYIQSRQSGPINTIKESSLGRFTHSVALGTRTSIKEGTPVNVTWDSPAEYVKLYVALPGVEKKEPFKLFGQSINCG